MASRGRAQSILHSSTKTKLSCVGFLRVLFITFIHTAQANKQAFIQSDTILEVLHFGEGSLLQTESDFDLSLYNRKSASPHPGNSRSILFQPPILDFHEQPVGMPKMEKVYLNNPSSEEISLISISATTAHFHASFFQNGIIPAGGNTSFDLVFLARAVGNVENTLFINTSHHGVFTYQVFGVGVPNPYRLRPFIGARVPVNGCFSPLINIHNPHSEPLQVVEMYSSDGDLHLDLPKGRQQGGTRTFWEVPPFETKGVMRASFSSRDADNHTAFIRIKTNEDQVIILPVEVEVTSAPGIYSSTEMLDFGMLRSQDRPKRLNLLLLNSGVKDVSITSIRTTPSNEAVTINFKAIILKAGERYTEVASISFDASKAERRVQFSGKITVKVKEMNLSKLEVPYHAEVLQGYLGFDHTATLFHIRDGPVDPVNRPIFITNAFNFAVRIHDVVLPDEAKTMFSVQKFSGPVLIPPRESRIVFSLLFRPVRPSIHIDGNVLLITNASKFHLPVRAYTGYLEPLVLSPSLKEHLLDFGLCSSTDFSSIVFIVLNNNPIELEIKSWLVTGDSLSVELLRTDRGNRTAALGRSRELHNISASQHKTVILSSGYYAAFRVTLEAHAVEGLYDGAVHITTDYQILTIPVMAVIAVGKLNSHPEHIILPPSFPGKIVHQSLIIQSSFTQRARLHHIRSLTEDVRFYYKKLRHNRDGLEPRRKSKVANIYFDAGLQCGDRCYVGLPFVLKSEARPHGLVLQEDVWDADVDLHQKLLGRWRELKDRSGHQVEAVFEVSTDLQKTVQATITAQQIWPSLVNASQQITFPLTNTNSSSEMEVVLENPADVPVYVQIFPLALYPNPSVFVGKLGDRFPLGKLSNIDTKSLEFQVNRNLFSVKKGSSGFVDGSTRPLVYNVVLQPGEVTSFSLRFTPSSNNSVSSLLIVRNNLTVLDVIVVHGQGTTGSLQVAGTPPGPGTSLLFQVTEASLKDCTQKIKSKEPKSTLRRTFRVENTGLLPLYIRSAEINGQPCQGYGFKVLNCQQFALKPNASEDLVILFTPDFTSSRVIRELKLVTEGGSEFVFVLNASLPFHMLASCTETLPRPSWELELYVIISLVMSSMFLLVIAIAYLEAQGIWEPFKRRLSLDCPMETGRPFDLREMVRISSDANLNDFSDAHQNSTRGMYSSGSEVSRVGSRNNRASMDLDGHRTRMGFGRSTMQTSSTSSSSQLANGAPVSCQLTNRKSRSSKRRQGGGLLDLQNGGPGSGSSMPHRRCCSGGEDPDYASLLGAMDNDLDRPESPPLQEYNVPLSTQNNVLDSKGKQLRGKTQRKRPEKERRAKGEPLQGDQLKDVLADNDDGSSTTTETSNPDVEASNKEEPVKKKGRTAVTLEKEETKPQNNKRQTNTNDQCSSLELPYITALENKQRKTFTSKGLVHSALTTTAPKARTLQKPRPGSLSRLNSSDSSVLVPCGKLEDYCPFPAVKRLSNSSVSELGHSSSVEGEKEFAATEWDIPLLAKTTNPDSLQQISLQTMNADAFLKRPISARTYSTSPSCPSLVTRGTYSQVLNANSETNLKKTPGNKLANATSLPGKNGNPTFAAVAAGYDRSPGGSGPGQRAQGKTHMTSVESDRSDSSGLWSPVGFNSANSFSAFGPNNSFNLTGVFTGMSFPKTSEPQQTWSELSSASTSIWDVPSSPLHSWLSSSSAVPTSSVLGNSRNPWSTTTPFGNSIWSTSGDTALHSFTPTTSSTLPDLPSGIRTPGLAPEPARPAALTEMSRSYNPWRSNVGRHGSEPWSSH
ncbi:transmembrane protein 131 isoform X2 [Salmo salar]|uniref:Transmembrane protein 131 isoform X2 n=1 Tax=Salmo salar TaxID=8030 RepID=A0ABM3D3R1_SALSA|nr:transmembrane protein 131 isoform X2 [Salmo salar]